MSDNQRIQVLENYRDFTPPVWVPKTVSRLIEALPEEYLRGLKIISLSNIGGLNHRRRRQKTLSRKRRVAIRESQGLYHQKWQGQPARIELFVDKIVQGWPAFILKIPLFQDAVVAGVLYHEIGHHIHKTSAPEHREREDVADDWRKKLGQLYFPKKYWYFKPLWKLVKLMVWLSKIIRGRQATANDSKKG